MGCSYCLLELGSPCISTWKFCPSFTFRGPDSFGPKRSGSKSRILCCILRKGQRHKDRFDQDKVVGSWRHRNYLFCAVSSLLMHLMYTLHMHPSLLDFTWPNRCVKAKWQVHKLIHWDTYPQAYNATKAVLDGCNVVLNK